MKIQNLNRDKFELSNCQYFFTYIHVSLSKWNESTFDVLKWTGFTNFRILQSIPLLWSCVISIKYIKEMKLGDNIGSFLTNGSLGLDSRGGGGCKAELYRSWHMLFPFNLHIFFFFFKLLFKIAQRRCRTNELN